MAQAWGLLQENLLVQHKTPLQQDPLTELEKRWLGPIMVIYGDVEPVVKEVPRWMLWIDEKGLKEWIKHRDTSYLLFDGATKGNLEPQA